MIEALVCVCVFVCDRWNTNIDGKFTALPVMKLQLFSSQFGFP